MRARARFLVVDQALGGALVNFAINGALGWLAYRALPLVPLFGKASIAADLAATAFVLPFLTALIATPLVRVAVARGKVAPLPSGRRPRAAVVRGLALGLASVLLGAAPLVAAFWLAGAAQLPPARFVWLKASFAAALAALVTPLVAWWALQDS